MKIIITGGGELGKILTGIFCNDRHDIIVIERMPELLARIREKFDVMTICGNAASSSILKKACSDADILIAATGDDCTNITSCQLAANMGVGRTICRLSTMDYFSETSNFLPSLLGISNIILPENETAQKIIDSVKFTSIIENIDFGAGGIEITGFRLSRSSPLVGVRLSDFPDKELLSSIRFTGIIRNNELIIPKGDTILASNDDVYVSGSKEKIKTIVEWASEGRISMSGKPSVIVSGGTKIGRIVAGRLASDGYDVKMIEENADLCEEIMNELGNGINVINGAPTDEEILEEAGVGSCHAFVGTLRDDEDNILSCIMAKRKYASRVVSLTNRFQYQAIVAAISAIDCNFSPGHVAVNSILRLFSTQKSRISAILNRTDAFIIEFKVAKNSRVCGKTVAASGCPPDVIFPFLIRYGAMVTATGNTVIEENDIVSALATRENVKIVEKLFA